MNKNTLLAYATMAVPRYTSYPTAADFVTLDDQKRIDWLSQIRENQPVSLYIHIPYCRQLCHYCGCHAKMAVRNDVIDDYADSVVEDIKLQSRYLSGKPQVVHLHWGGGTPSILSRQSFEKIMSALRDGFSFALDCEHAIELDPRTVTPNLVTILRDIGVNRASLGVQDVNPEVQKAIGRVQPIKTVERAVTMLRNAGINNLNFDLIYGLPLQTHETLRKTCEIVNNFAPNRVACYGYAHLPKRRANQKLIDPALLPDEMERFYQAEVVKATFVQMGYVPIGIDHYALEGDTLAQAARTGNLHRNFQGYTDDLCPVIIGFGCSSISQFENGFAQIQPAITGYRHAIAEGKLATIRGIEIDDEDRLRGALISDLMCNFKVDLAQFGGSGRFSDELRGLKPIIADGLVTEHQGLIEMTEEGKPFVRTVAALFDAYRKQNDAQFSAAV